MLRRHSYIRNSSCIVAGFLGLLLATPAAVRADSTLATYAMMEDQAAMVGLLAYNSSPDPSSPLSFTSSVDPTGSSFAYLTGAGATYLGEPVSVSDTAVLSGTSYVTGGSISLGLETYSSTGSIAISTLADGSTQLDLATTIAPPAGFPPPNANDIEIFANIKNGIITDTGYFTLNGVKIPMSDFTSKGKVLPNGDWDIDLYPVYKTTPVVPQIVSTGFSPTGGGAGTFTTTASVPEPSSLTLAALGGLISLGYIARRGRGRIAA